MHCQDRLRVISARLSVLFVLLLFAQVTLAAPPQVVASNRPLHSLLSGLMQGVAEPELLIAGIGAPWDFKPDEGARRSIDQARLLVWGGPELEPALAPLMTEAAAAKVVYEVLASESLKVLPARDDDSQRDPFFWLDSRNMLILLDDLAHLLIELDPDRALVYEQNWRKVTKVISEVDRTLEFGYRDVSGIPVFLYHDTHQYFQQAYAMHVAGSVSSVGAQSDGDTQRLLEMRNLIGQAKRTCVFTEKALDEPHIDLLLAGTDVRAVELDSFGVGLEPGADLYVQLMRSNFAAISGCVDSARPSKQLVATDTYPVPDIRRFPNRIKPRYLMRDQHGRSVSNSDFAGRFQLIYFGYTYCPDICPTSLAIMSHALQMLGEDADQIQPIFITVDPLRDTPELLAEYVTYFHPRMLGLSASPEATKRTAELFKARYERVPAEDGNPDRYVMDHTASLFLLGRNGEFITKFAHGFPASEMVQRLQQVIAE